MKDAVLKRFEEELSRSAPAVRRQRVAYAHMYLEHADPSAPWSRTAVQKFLNWIERQGYAGTTQALIYSVVRRLFDAARVVAEEERQQALTTVDPQDPAAVREILLALATPLPIWPMGKRDGPKSGSVMAPALTKEEVGLMVTLAIRNELADHEAAYLAVATTYGPRREELSRLNPESVDWKKGTIFIDTCKGGVAREHQIPPQIAAHLKKYDFSTYYSPFNMSRLYISIEARAGVEHREGAGFHSLRRLLDTALVDKLGTAKAATFLRWKTKASSEMALRYYTAEADRVDAQVFAKHPLLPLWERCPKCLGKIVRDREEVICINCGTRF